MDKKKFAPVVFATAAFAGSCSSDSGVNHLEIAQAAKAEYIAEYTCDNESLTIETSDDQELFEQMGANPEQILMFDALTDDNGITLNTELLEDEPVVRTVTLHEMVHACRLQGNEVTYDAHLAITDDPELVIIGAHGLSPTFKVVSTGEIGGNPLIEEGLAEWVAAGFGDFETTDDIDAYGAVRELTQMLSDMRGFTREQLVEMQLNDDLLGFASLVYSKAPEELTGDELFTLVSMYQTAMDTNSVPARHEQILEFLGISE